MPYSGRSVNRTQYKQTYLGSAPRRRARRSSGIQTNLVGNVETPGVGHVRPLLRRVFSSEEEIASPAFRFHRSGVSDRVMLCSYGDRSLTVAALIGALSASERTLNRTEPRGHRTSGCRGAPSIPPTHRKTLRFPTCPRYARRPPARPIRGSERRPRCAQLPSIPRRP